MIIVMTLGNVNSERRILLTGKIRAPRTESAAAQRVAT